MLKRKRLSQKESYSDEEIQLAETIDAILFPEEHAQPDKTVAAQPSVARYAHQTKGLLDTARSIWRQEADNVPENPEAHERIKQVFLEQIRGLQPEREEARDTPSIHGRILAFLQEAVSPLPGAMVPAFRPEESSPMLIQRSAAGAGSTIRLANEKIRIGRASEADLRITDSQKVSRQHAEITPITDGYAITDRQSRHGTTLNGEKLDPGVHYRLRHGDRIQFADITFEFSNPAEEGKA
jgi:hypothetical protein